jgi:hypothetical protein
MLRRSGWLVCLLLCAGCINKVSYQGVTNFWRAEHPPEFTRGVSTMSDVVGALGPPSQIISSQDRTILYYLLEKRREWSLILLSYNHTRERILYDRAIFFFDAEHKLTDLSYSNEKIPFHEIQKPKKK